MSRRPASLPARPELERIHVVLVEPGDSLNVGSVARAMSNLGFRHLHLVAPPRLDRERAAQTACWATDVLAEMRVHDTLADALSPMHAVAGFTARHGRHRPRHVRLGDWAEAVRAAPAGDTALLFGPEDHGLRAEHLEHCRWLVRIPSAAANPSFNLAQAVLLALFELTRADWGAVGRAEERRPAAWRDFYALEHLVESVLTRVGFYKDGTPAYLPGLVKHLLRRTDPDRRELSILLGIFGKIDRALAGEVPLRPPPAAGPAPQSEQQSEQQSDSPPTPAAERANGDSTGEAPSDAGPSRRGTP